MRFGATDPGGGRRRSGAAGVPGSDAGGHFGIDSAFAVALHTHQPLIPAGGPDLRTAAIVSNLQWMLEHPDLGDNHNAPAFHWCYKRMDELIPQLLSEGSQPRIMLEYFGTLLHGLRRAGLDDVFDALRPLTCDPDLRQAVEWLGCPGKQSFGMIRFAYPCMSQVPYFGSRYEMP